VIALSFNTSSFDPTAYDIDKQIKALMSRYKALPKHLAKKHMQAAMRRCLQKGVPVLRRHTPPLGMKKGRKKAGTRSTGALRRSVTVRTGFTGRNTDWDAFVWGVLGYKAGEQSRKAIWLQYGTAAGGPRYDMIGRAMAEYGQPSAQRLAAEMALALEKATAELESNMNPTRKYEVGGGWTPG
jgi:hypothetical protein